MNKRGPSIANGAGRGADPDELSPQQRLHEIAAILAKGVLRLRHRRLSDGILTQSTAERLEVSAKSVLSGGIGIWPVGPNKTSR